MALTPEQLARIAAKAARFTQNALGDDRTTRYVDAEGHHFPLGRGGRLVPKLGDRGSHAPAFNRSPLGEDGYSLRRVVQALATGNPGEAAFEMSLSKKLVAAGFLAGPAGVRS